MNARALKDAFPLLRGKEMGRDIVYLDSAATSQKPAVVIDAIAAFYTRDNANIYRGVYELAGRATAQYETAREKVAAFIGCAADELIFTRGTTESVNLVAWTWARDNLAPGDEVLTSPAEHHSNLVPWQEACRATGAGLRFVELGPVGEVTVEAVRRALTPRTKLVALAQASNVLGTVAPIREIAAAVHEAGALLLVDAAQSVPHMPVDVKDLGCDFLAFSGHKMLGPMGIGGLYARREILEGMSPFHTGGEMIRHVDLDAATYKDTPQRFEAGTPNAAGAVGLAAAVDFLTTVGMDEVFAHDCALGDLAARRLRQIPDVSVYGPEGPRTGVVAFNLEGIHPHDLATALDQHGICVRAGHHCCQPLMHELGVPSTARASFYLYNTEDDVDRLVEGVVAAREFFGHVVR